MGKQFRRGGRLGFVFNVMVSKQGFWGRVVCFDCSVMVTTMGFLGDDYLFFCAVMVSWGVRCQIAFGGVGFGLLTYQKRGV